VGIRESVLGGPNGGEGPARPQLAVEPLAAEHLVAIVAPGHRLAGRRAIAIEELRDEAFVAFHRGATIRDLVDERTAAVGVSLRVAFETADATRARALVAHGLAVGVLPHSDAAAPGPAVAVIPFRGPVSLRRGSRTGAATRLRRPEHGFVVLSRASRREAPRGRPGGTERVERPVLG
jgi:DNA-binding transcriptional LysR family regulator